MSVIPFFPELWMLLRFHPSFPSSPSAFPALLNAREGCKKKRRPMDAQAEEAEARLQRRDARDRVVTRFTGSEPEACTYLGAAPAPMATTEV